MYQQALVAHRQGHLDRAEYCYRSILDGNPRHAGAWHFLGMISHARGRMEEALHYVEMSLQIGPPKLSFYNNYGTVLMSLQRVEEAEIAFGKAAAIR